MKRLNRRGTRKLLMKEFKAALRIIYEEADWTGRSARELYDALMEEIQSDDPTYNARDIGRAMHFLNVLRREGEMQDADAQREMSILREKMEALAEREGLDWSHSPDRARVIRIVHRERIAAREKYGQPAGDSSESPETAVARVEIWDLPGDSSWEYAKVEDVWHARRRGDEDWISLAADRYSSSRDSLDTKARRRG